MKRIQTLLFSTLLILVGCAVKPPVQEMSDARSAIQTARALPSSENKSADTHLKNAEMALSEATKAINQNRYEHARSKAIEAKREAQKAAQAKQQSIKP